MWISGDQFNLNINLKINRLIFEEDQGFTLNIKVNTNLCFIQNNCYIFTVAVGALEKWFSILLLLFILHQKRMFALSYCAS